MMHRSIKTLACSLVAFLLTACGGGGGSGGGAPDNGVRVTLDRTSVSFTFLENQPVVPERVTATVTGSISGTVFIGAVDEGAAIDRVEFQAAGSRADALIYPKADLLAGNYSSRLRINVCYDAVCARPLPGSPFLVTYSVTVNPGVRAAPSPVAINVVGGQAGSQIVSVTLPAGVAAFTTQITSNSPWLTVVSESSTGFVLNAAPSRSGSYSGAVRVTAGPSSLLLPVTYNVSMPPGGERDLSLNVSTLNFSALEGTATPVQTIGVNLPSWSSALTTTVTYLQSEAGWLTVTRRGDGNLDVVADARSRLIQGTYSARLRVESGFGSTPALVDVSFTVGAGISVPSAVDIVLGSDSSQGALTASVPVTVPSGNPTFVWSATSSQPWLQVTSGTGSSATAIPLRVDPAHAASVANFGETSAVVTVTPVTGLFSPRTFNVRFTKRLAEVHAVAPYAIANDTATAIIVRGRGFAQLADPAARLRFGGVAPSSVVRVNDTQLNVQLPSLAAGVYPATISNVSAMATERSDLTVLAPTNYTYAAIQTAGDKRSMAFDPVHQMVFTVNGTNKLVQRFTYVNGVWQYGDLGGAAVVNPTALAMAPDGKSVVVTTESGTVLKVNPTTLTSQVVGSVPGGIGALFGGESRTGIGITNDGRVWIPQGMAPFFDMSYFDLRSGATTVVPLGPNRPYSGPWFSVSGDGSRLVAVPADGISPPPQVLYVDAANGEVRVNPISLTYRSGPQSRDGRRMLAVDLRCCSINGTVYDRDFTRIGDVALPAQFGIMGAAAISPDGNRVYVLAYEGSTVGTVTFNGSTPPRVFVFDSSAPVSLATHLPLLGYFEIADFPATGGAFDLHMSARAMTSIDGKALFLLGNSRLIVAPIPSTLTPFAPVSFTAPVQKWILP
jgi:hypothetical protein